ncbi:MAG: secretin N-terminal domain-containing protein [Kiritimatiellae bacterium]|nr:secretin N-terminal domain-containing protein [Kiritimatiellia bacterium]
MKKRKPANRLLRRKSNTIWGIVLFVCLAFLAPAQVPPAPVPAPVPAAPPAAVPTPDAPVPAATPVVPSPVVLPGSKPAGTAPISPQLKFEEATIQMVLKEYSEATKRTLLIDPKVPAPAKGITLRNEGELTMEEYLQAIETVLAMNSIGLVTVGEKFLKVVPIEAARMEGMNIRDFQEGAKLKETDALVSQMIQLKNIDVAEATKLMDTLKFHHPYGKIHGFERTNCILLTDTAANVKRILEILNYIDQPIEIREETKVIAIRFAKATLIKTKLEEIIAESQKDQSTVARTKDRGSPGVVAAPTPAVARPVVPPGVIRPVLPKTATSEADTSTEAVLAKMMDEAERGIIRGKCKIIADDRTNVLIIITRPENLQFFDKIVKILDVPTDPDVMVKVLRLEYAEAELTATTLNTLIGAQQQQKESGKAGAVAKTADAGGGEAKGAATLADFARQQREALTKVTEGEGIKSKVGELSAQNIKILADKRINSLIIMASKLDMATIEEIIKEMDMAVSQVLIEVLILDVRLGNQIQTGVDWIQRSLIAYDRNSDGSRKPKVGFAGGGGGAMSQTATMSDFIKPFSPGAGLTYYLTYYGLNADIVAKMLANDSRSRILSSPIILTTDNKKAQLDVTSDKYFYKGQNYVSTGVGSYNSVDNVDTKSVGIKLVVTPHISKNKNVQMEITQEISDATGEQKLGKDAVPWPIMSVNKFDATVSVRSGMTIVLGGLSSEDKSITHAKIPILGDLPLLGLLFGSSDSKKNRHEILVFLTPYVMDSADEIESDASRRQTALGEEGRWKRGWSNSNLSDPSKEELREREKREIENEKRARAAAKKMEMEARRIAVTTKRTAPAVEAMQNVELQGNQTTSNGLNNANVASNTPAASLDPAIIEFIKRNEKEYDANLKKVDQRILQEIIQPMPEKKP